MHTVCTLYIVQVLVRNMRCSTRTLPSAPGAPCRPASEWIPPPSRTDIPSPYRSASAAPCHCSGQRRGARGPTNDIDFRGRPQRTLGRRRPPSLPSTMPDSQSVPSCDQSFFLASMFACLPKRLFTQRSCKRGSVLDAPCVPVPRAPGGLARGPPTCRRKLDQIVR